MYHLKWLHKKWPWRSITVKLKENTSLLVTQGRPIASQLHLSIHKGIHPLSGVHRTSAIWILIVTPCLLVACLLLLWVREWMGEWHFVMLEAEELTLIGLDLISMGLPLYAKINPNPLKVRLLTHVLTQIYKQKHTYTRTQIQHRCMHSFSASNALWALMCCW